MRDTVHFSDEFRKRLSEKLMELANISIGALVFAPFVSDHTYSIFITLLGILFAMICYYVSYMISS